MHARHALSIGFLLASAAAHGAADDHAQAYRRTIALKSSGGEVSITVPPVQAIEYSALRQSRHGDVLELSGDVAISVVENEHSQFTLTAQSASITKQAISPAEAAAITELEAMRSRDQQYRGKPAPTAEDMRLQEESDRTNKTKLVDIVERYGWPAYTFGGMTAAKSAFLVLQHCGDLELQERYLPLLRAAARVGQASPADLALLEDRVRVRRGQPQIYGSQLRSLSPPTPQPIDDAAHVDQRRDAVGLEPLADYLKRFESDAAPASPAR